MTWGGPSLPSGIDQFDRKQEPAVEGIDDLSWFVLRRILEAESEPRVDGVARHAHEIHGAVAHRYAAKVREDMVAFRRIVRQYVELAESGWPPDALASTGFRAAVQVLAMRWEDHPEFRDDWRL